MAAIIEIGLVCGLYLLWFAYVVFMRIVFAHASGEKCKRWFRLWNQNVGGERTLVVVVAIVILIVIIIIIGGGIVIVVSRGLVTYSKRVGIPWPTLLVYKDLLMQSSGSDSGSLDLLWKFNDRWLINFWWKKLKTASTDYLQPCLVCLAGQGWWPCDWEQSEGHELKVWLI